ncbi:NADPH-dependent assimilatory sulfite reductase hemoprotein subunit [Arachidicoccus soli]|uniref:assimilatory sulfite reductase (NADPH) n=1 Tax=Arachidicoccus soli TaxID=2341117 RepID=A0A386HSY6_9BACT|nr:NADPH-dependent assimilatory sulfite reductase hemoprotein subunit [Arachidicoccus soli]AYD48571.1 NADPH-dependent assimilatory sulfite reductase hemoprotein subunit [Arachidicoccus soli]
MSINESSTEKIKKASRGLRGTLLESLADEHTGDIREDDKALVKFHGMYMQDDRDLREERAAKKLDRLWAFMVRLRLPGGFLTAEQWEMLHGVTKDYTSGTIKITTRQTVQLHGILKRHARPTHQAFNLAGLDSIAACGDVNRNVLASAHPDVSPVHEEVYQTAVHLSTLLKPKTRAYYEIFVGSEKVAEKVEEDPLYQDRYLPRKFKIGIAIPPQNDIDVFANDCALIAIVENGRLIGYNVGAGGGMGATHGNSATYPRLASLFGFVKKEDLDKVVYEIATVQRDFGNREDRKLSRLKYTIDRIGIEVYRTEVEKRSGVKFEPLKAYTFTQRTDDYGWAKNHEGKWYYTAFVENGRVLDENGVQFQTAFLEIAKSRKANFRFTCNQNIIVSDVKEQDRDFIETILQKYNIIQHTAKSSVLRKSAIACVALNTCALALAESQRYLPSLITKIESLVGKYQLENEDISIRMTGCPNGCARPYMAEIGFVGTSLGHYNMHIGADALGTRMNKLYRENLDEADILVELENLLASFANEKNGNEAFGDFVMRKELV